MGRSKQNKPKRFIPTSTDNSNSNSSASTSTSTSSIITNNETIFIREALSTSPSNSNPNSNSNSNSSPNVSNESNVASTESKKRRLVRREDDHLESLKNDDDDDLIFNHDSKRRKSNTTNPFLKEDDDEEVNDNDDDNDMTSVSASTKELSKRNNNNLFSNDIHDDPNSSTNNNDNDNGNNDIKNKKSENESKIEIIPCRRKDCNYIVRYSLGGCQNENQDDQVQMEKSSIETKTASAVSETTAKDKLVLLQKIMIQNVILQTISSKPGTKTSLNTSRTANADNNNNDDSNNNESITIKSMNNGTNNDAKKLFDWIIKLQKQQKKKMNIGTSTTGTTAASTSANTAMSISTPTNSSPATAINNNDNSNDNGNDNDNDDFPTNYNSIQSAIEYNLIQLVITQKEIKKQTQDQTQQRKNRKSRKTQTRNKNQIELQFYLTNKAYTLFSPMNLGQNMLSSPSSSPTSILKRCKKEKKEMYIQLIIIQNVIYDLFLNTIASDLIVFKSNNGSMGGGSKGKVKDKSKGNVKDVITAKMVYNAIDDVHLKQTEQEKGQHDGSSSSIDNDANANSDNNHNDENGNTSMLKSCRIQGLKPTLRKYQKGAVEWMVQRERGEIDDRGWEICWLVMFHADTGDDTDTDTEIDTHKDADRDRIVNMNKGGNVDDSSSLEMDKNTCSLFEWKEKNPNIILQGDGHKYDNNDITKQNVNIVFYNPITGWLVRSYDEAKKYTLDEETEGDSIVRGGILAESMGLGKTVELLACILSNPCPEQNISRRESTSINVEQEENGQNLRSNENGANFHDQSPVLPSYSCYCGCLGTTSSLSWVKCSRCGQSMHGICAGYASQDDLVTHSLAGVPRICDESHCPFCQHKLGQSGIGGLVSSRATLIVTPTSILNQWEREISRHTSISSVNCPDSIGRPLKVIVYPGVKEICSTSHTQAIQSNVMQLLHPQKLADADVVLTTFDILRGELGHCNDNPFVGSRRMRKEKKYRVVPSPLVSINWWRICLDEAQRIETSTAGSAKMALNLVSRNKWCISGTPIGRGKMDDLFGLCLFLNAKPFCYKQCFSSYLKVMYRDITRRIRHSTFDLMWRSTKANESIRIQMGIPEQVEVKTVLKFSSVERHFYQRQLEYTLLAADAAIIARGKRTRKKDFEDLSVHLHRLRAACCHPQVGSSGISKVAKRKAKQSSGNAVTTGVLNMAQILDRLIDDAKVKAEESQRVFTLHTNALACLTKLKAEGRKNEGSDICLYRKSCDYYFEALNVADKNSSPTTIVGEAILSGCNGFQSQNTTIRDGTASLLWRVILNNVDAINSLLLQEMWCRFDFTGPMKKINSFAVRPLQKNNYFQEGFSDSLSYRTLYPKDCVLQVSNAAVGGIFVDAVPFTLHPPNEETASIDVSWQRFTSVRPNKSKSWRVLVKNYHHDTSITNNNDAVLNFFVGIEIQLMEPDIAYDNLQRMHILHNISSSLLALSEQILMLPEKERDQTNWGNSRYSPLHIQKTIANLKEESERLELHYIEAARTIQQASNDRLQENIRKRKEILSELNALSSGYNGSKQPWYVDLLTWCHLYGNLELKQSLCTHVERGLFELFDDPSQTFRRRTFPEFNNLDGLNLAMNLRLENTSTFYNELKVPDCISKVQSLSAHPSELEVLENSQCKKCRADWDQRGPLCQCCKIEKDLVKYEETIKESETNCVLKAMAEWFDENFDRMKNTNHRRRDEAINFSLKNLEQRKEKFVLFKDAALKELTTARRKWRTHFNLLSDIDELNQCKRSMRLSYENENLFDLTENEAAFIVQPCDIAALIMDHSAKQAMAEANLRRSKEILRFLRNQHIEFKEGSGEICCAICLTTFGNDRAVLRCGHMFHYSPCIEKLLSRGGGNVVTCPMRCAIQTRKEDILVASEKRSDDGSRNSRKIEGCWGTKVDRLISDVMDVVAKGEKSIVFSQWDDMLSIMGHALEANRILFIRPRTIKKLGEDMKNFRTNNCYVLLMHVKHGAEGLTVVEANHIFMIEPLLNHSVDSQAINRIHRIGQTQKTFVHRYLISDTIEVKIDKMRMERQQHPDGDGDVRATNVNNQKGDAICSAGTFDGGFNHSELQELLR